MRSMCVMALLAVSLCSVCAARERGSFATDDEIRAEAERGFREIVELWHSRKYDELYERTLANGKQTRKGFADRLAAASFTPACCWKQVQDVRVTVKNDDAVVVRAKIGLDGPGDTESRTGSFKLRREEGIWCISRGDILSLAGASKKKRYTGTHRRFH